MKRRAERALSATAGLGADASDHTCQQRIPLRDARLLPHFISVVAVSFAFFMGHSIILPSLPLYASTFTASSAQVGLVVAGFAIGRVAFNTIGGTTADRFGLRRVAALGCVVTAGGAVLAAVSPTIAWLLTARLVQGVGSAFYLIPAYTYVASLAAEDGLGRVLSFYQGTILLGNSFGPAVGGFVASIWGLRAPNFVFAALVAVGIVLTIIFFPNAREPIEPAAGRPTTGRSRSAARSLLSRRIFTIPMLVCLVTFAMRGGIRMTLLPLFAAGAFSFSEGRIGLLMSIATVCNVAVIPNAGRLMDRIGRRPIVIWSMAATTVVMLFLGVTTSAWMLYLGAGLLGAVTGYAGSVPAAIAVDIAEPRTRSTAIGLQRMAADLGIIVGPLFVGWMLGVASFHSVLLTCAAIAGATTLFSVLMAETLGIAGRRAPARELAGEPDVEDAT